MQIFPRDLALFGCPCLYIAVRLPADGEDVTHDVTFPLVTALSVLRMTRHLKSRDTETIDLRQ